MPGEVQSDAKRDNNRIPILIGVSSVTGTINGVSYVAGVTPVMIAVDPVTHYVIAEIV